MGHNWLGKLPKSKAWVEVVELIAAGADVPQVASATLKAADKAFSFVSDDAGFNQAVWLMTQLGLAAKKENPIQFLRDQGVKLPDNTSLPGIIASLSEAVDNHTDQSGRRSDLSEIAQRALVDAVVGRMEPKLRQSLFAVTSEDVERVLSDFGKQKEFSRLSRDFFARLTNDCMGYFLSLTLASNLGEGQRFTTMNQMAQFEEALSTHCHEASKIVEKFSEEWFSKHRYEEGGEISRKSVEGFASWAMKKMKDELRAGAEANAE